jgi:hypothetical protein
MLQLKIGIAASSGGQEQLTFLVPYWPLFEAEMSIPRFCFLFISTQKLLSRIYKLLMSVNLRKKLPRIKYKSEQLLMFINVMLLISFVG